MREGALCSTQFWITTRIYVLQNVMLHLLVNYEQRKLRDFLFAYTFATTLKTQCSAKDLEKKNYLKNSYENLEWFKSTLKNCTINYMLTLYLQRKCCNFPFYLFRHSFRSYLILLNVILSPSVISIKPFHKHV